MICAVTDQPAYARCDIVDGWYRLRTKSGVGHSVDAIGEMNLPGLRGRPDRGLEIRAVAADLQLQVVGPEKADFRPP